MLYDDLNMFQVTQHSVPHAYWRKTNVTSICRDLINSLTKMGRFSTGS
jgi:hypothetical protein